MLIIIKIGKGIYIVPDTFIRRVKNMRPVFVDIDMGFPIIIGIAIAADMIALFDNQNFFAGFFLRAYFGRGEKCQPNKKSKCLQCEPRGRGLRRQFFGGR